jgi:hypothetical protein
MWLVRELLADDAPSRAAARYHGPRYRHAVIERIEVPLKGRFMRKTLISSAICAVVFTATSALGQQAGVGAAATQQAADKHDSSDKFTLDGQAALWTVAIKADKTTDFERVLARLRQALLMSDKPERRQQAQGWTVLRLMTPLPDGNVAYVHDVRPVVPGADYSVMRILYDAFPDERQALYEVYRGAFVKNVALATGNVVMDTQAVTTPDTATSVASPASPTPAPPPSATPSPGASQPPAR